MTDKILIDRTALEQPEPKGYKPVPVEPIHRLEQVPIYTCQQPPVPAIPPGYKLVPVEPTRDMIEAGAQRLVSWEDGCTWPGSWDALQVRAARNDAERVWRSMWCAVTPEGGAA